MSAFEHLAVHGDEHCGCAARLRERGIELSVIPGSREAALSFSGASIDFSGERLMVVDVGGGSPGVGMGTGGAEPVCAHSFNVGCRRVTEKFLASDPPAPDELVRARAWIREQMASWFADQAKEAADLERVVAVAGTATTVVSIRDRMETYDSSRVHKARVSRQELLEVYERLAALPLSARKKVVGLDPKRAPVMVAGLLILLTDIADNRMTQGFQIGNRRIDNFTAVTDNLIELEIHWD